MKRSMIALACFITVLLACNEEQSRTILVPAKAIPIDSANKMIGSYLESINYTANDTDLHSIVVDAATLRYYLDSIPEGSGIRGFKFMFAHRLDYINSGMSGQPSGYNKNALTAVIAAYDDSGDYVMLLPGQVMDFNNPCPSDCPPGEAANPFIIQ